MLLSIFPVWSELGLMGQVYWAITAPSSLIFIVLLIISFFSSDVDSDVNFDHDGIDGDGIPFQFLSIKNIVGFFVMFGWSGLGFISAGLAPWLVIFLSTVCGVIMMTLMASLFYFMSHLAETGNLNLKNAIGRVGEVYLTIPASRTGHGKVQLTVQGTNQTLEAVTDEPEVLVTGSYIEVVDVINQNILVVKKS